MIDYVDAEGAMLIRNHVREMTDAEISLYREEINDEISRRTTRDHRLRQILTEIAGNNQIHFAEGSGINEPERR